MAAERSMRILIVDDMLTMRKIIRDALKQEGFSNLVEVDDGIPAWKSIQEAQNEGRPYDFIISDWNMPGMTGIDLLRKVKAEDSLKKTPFLMITAEAEQDNVVTAIKEGVSNYIVKPFTKKDFMDKIERIFK